MVDPFDDSGLSFKMFNRKITYFHIFKFQIHVLMKNDRHAHKEKHTYSFSISIKHIHDSTDTIVFLTILTIQLSYRNLIVHRLKACTFISILTYKVFLMDPKLLIYE